MIKKKLKKTPAEFSLLVHSNKKKFFDVQFVENRSI